MLDNGVPMLAALHIAKDGTGNVVMSRAIAAAADAVKAGQHLAVPLEESKLFEDDVIEMIRMGEAANNLDEVLLKVATTIEGRLSRGLQIATKLIEPLVLVVIGGVVLTVAMALILPLVQASSNIG
jgi:general secretion pathway protein F/type IV pilus assembly protein PilC